MARPPLHPIQVNGTDRSYFELLVLIANDYLKEDGIKLNFQGYKETIVEYANLKEHETEKAWRLAKDLNTWSEYFSSVANLIQKTYLDAETDKQSAQSIASFDADPNKVANGDRLSNKDTRVISARKKRNALKSLYEELEAKVKFLERAHYHCKSTYEIISKQKTYEKPNDYQGRSVS